MTMRPHDSTINALRLGQDMSFLEWNAYADEYPKARNDLMADLRGIGLNDVELPATYEEFDEQGDELHRKIGTQLNANRSRLGGDVLGLPMFYLGYLPLRCISRHLFKSDWEMERVLLEAALQDLDLDVEHMRVLEKEAGWVQIFAEAEDVKLSSNDVRLASVRFVQYVLEQWAKNHPGDGEIASSVEPASNVHRDAVLSAVICALRERRVFEAMSAQVQAMAEPGDRQLDLRDHVGFAEQWLRWYGGGLPRDRIEARIWKAFEELSIGDAGVSLGHAVVSGRLRSVLADPTKSQHVILLIHGIRTEAHWQEMVASVLAQFPDTQALPIRYGWFDTLRFWLPFGRDVAINHLRQKIASAAKLARATDAYVQISVVAHSFGTYSIGRILEGDHDLHLHRLALCGAIVPRDFKWETVREQITGGVLNDCGSRDLWPVLAQSLSWGYGASGTFGFGHPRVMDRFHDFGHSGYFQRDFVMNYWIPFLIEGRVERNEWEENRTAPPYWMSLTSILPLRWIVPFGALVATGLMLARSI